METTGLLRIALGSLPNLVRIGLACVLEETPGFELIGTGQSYRSLARLLASPAPPQVVVLDEQEAIYAVLRGLREVTPRVGIVVITHSTTSASRLLNARMSHSGVPCLSTNASSGEVRITVRAAVGGNVQAGLSALSVRENAVLSLLLGQARPAEIALQLHITESTVRSHIRGIYRKLGVKGRAQLLALDLSRAS